MTAKTSLVRPDGSSLGYSFAARQATPLTAEGMRSAQESFFVMRGNFEHLYARVAEGKLLDGILRLTSQKSFMDQSLERVARDTKFSNSMAKLFHGEHKYFNWSASFLPWVSIFTDYFISIPIPENQAAIAAAKESLGPLADILTDHRGFYDKLRGGVLKPVLRDTSIDVSELEITVLSNQDDFAEFVQPRAVEADSRTIEVNGERFYNGLPGDRAQYPTYLLPEGSQLLVKIKNTSEDKAYLVMPTINGIPFKASKVVLWSGGFETSDMPVLQVEPSNVYLKPGEEVKLNRFFCNSVVVTENRSSDYVSTIEDRAEQLSPMSMLAARLFDQQLTNAERELLEDGKYDPHFAQEVRYESRVAFTRNFLNNLKSQARETPIFMRKPVVAGNQDSSQLDNPFLGSLGLTIVEVTKPPVKAETSFGYSEYGGDGLMSYGVSKGGITGLSQVGGGYDSFAAREDSMSRWRFDDCIHRFVGYVPMNLMSTASYMSVVK